jgi:hypothetical protein
VWNTIIDEIDAGMPNGVRYSNAARAQDRAAWPVVVKHLARTEAQAKQIIATWVRNGVLISETYHDATERKDRKGLWANPTKRPG